MSGQAADNPSPDPCTRVKARRRPADASRGRPFVWEMSAHMPDSKPAMVTEDEIQAAIAEIENMSPAEAAAISDASDGSGDAPDSPEQPSPSGPDPSNASVADAPAEPASAPQPPVQPDGTASDPADSRDERSDTDHAGGITGRVSMWVSRFRAGLSRDSLSRAGLSRALARLRAGLRRKSADALPQETPQQPAATEEQSAPTAEALPAKGICRLVDRALDTLNKPFDRFSSQVRNAIGLAAIATVVISIAALLVLPRLMPHRDAVSFLREKRAQLDARPTAPAPPESPTAGNDSPRP